MIVIGRKADTLNLLKAQITSLDRLAIDQAPPVVKELSYLLKLNKNMPERDRNTVRGILEYDKESCMNREQKKDVIETIGMVAIVASLIFLGLEVRQNTNTQERAMQMERITSYADIYLNQPVLGDIFAKVKEVDGPEPLAAAFVDRYKLTTAEAVLWSRLVSRSIWIIQAQFLSDGPSEQLGRELNGLLEYWDFRKAFELNEDGFLSPEFVDYVNSIDDER